MYRVCLNHNKKLILGDFEKIEGCEVLSNENQKHHNIYCKKGKLFNNVCDEYDSGDIFIQVLDISKTVIAEYDGVYQEIREKSIMHEVIISGIGLPSMYPGSINIWEMRKKRYPENLNLWIGLQKSELQAWLEVSLKDKRRNVSIDKSSSRTVVINGNNIFNIDSFLCALGEAVSGPSGYVGRCLNSLEGCLMSPNYFGISLPRKVIWENYSNSLAEFRLNDQDKYIDEIVKIIRYSGVLLDIVN